MQENNLLFACGGSYFLELPKIPHKGGLLNSKFWPLPTSPTSIRSSTTFFKLEKERGKFFIGGRRGANIKFHASAVPPDCPLPYWEG